MNKFVVFLFSVTLLSGCHVMQNDHTHGSDAHHKHGTNMRDGDPERSIHQHRYNVVRNEAAVSAAVPRNVQN